MERRAFLMSMAATLIPKIIRVSSPLGTLQYMGPSPKYLIGGMAGGGKSDHILDALAYFGIPYHENNAIVGEWIGFPRGEKIYPDILSMMRILEQNKGPVNL